MNKINDISQKRFSQTTWFKQEYDIEVMHTLVDKRAQERPNQIRTFLWRGYR